MHLWFFAINQGTGISLPTGTSLDGVPICELVPYGAISWSAWQEFECTNFLKRSIFLCLNVFFNTPEINLQTTDERKFEIIEKLKKEFEFNNYEKVLIDGIRIENDESWGLARASNTTPSLVFRFEGESEEALKKIIAVFQKALFAIDDKLEIKLN